MGKACSKIWNCCKKEVSSAAIQTSEHVSSIEHSSSSVAPLLNTQEVSDSLSIARTVTPCKATPASTREHHYHEDYLNYPILLDEKTIKYCQMSKVMVILKGLPGSGKSFIARRIQQLYPAAVMCSADSFFMHDGVYKFDRDKLKEAHKSCQQKALDAAQSSCNVIVIDNTNVQNWEAKYYLNLTKKYHYTPLILEPQTPWAMDPKELAERNSHGVPEAVIEQKVRSYEPVLPLYYWWFLNEVDSKKISMIARQWLERALQVQNFFQDFAETTKLSTLEEMLNYHSRNTQQGGYNVLHATASVTRRGKVQHDLEYIQNPAVRKSLGKCFDLLIVGYVVTPRTFGARLKLGTSELELWGMDDNEIELENTSLPSENHTADKCPAECLDNSRDNLEIDSDRKYNCAQEMNIGTSSHCDTVNILSSKLTSDRFYPTSGKGSRAHITLGCAPNIHAKATGFDLIKVVSLEQRIKESEKSEDSEVSNLKVQAYSISEGTLKTYGDGIWVIYPEKEMTVSSMFSAFY
ncbi:hypothetical protein OTU49_006029 [Cherax quadricarinatus]|uniref:2',3'-cyclic-nucleotide 3'-phosphodiesterase n=1 Tax=Cherax quadricarinatus TaxID=27406 RepID=A0AAW0YRC5_CHEQU